MISIKQIPVLNDNYIWLINSSEKYTAVVDPAVPEPVISELKKNKWKLTHILNTHHHSDHTGANLELKRITNCKIIGPMADYERIPGIDIFLRDEDEFEFGTEIVKVIDVPGHTKGHIAFYFPNSGSLFCGDTLFALGCGRVFEGTMEQMWNSLIKLSLLPKQTRVYCAHEYTLSNGNFALTIEPNNKKLKFRMKNIIEKRNKGISTIPSTIEEEIDTNPFLRPDSLEIQRNLSLVGSPLLDIFTKTRQLKDSFRG
ncbi:MAG: Hydroxyacylglutathione hydrolase [Alphaproteobacteria bacterium MarineAlpha2_Bin1]|nr:MAG: Hydroxyacylglutathione hydrolase [Alphaproteobacteria bacterium MarineAlpha2_Bin1]